MYAPQSQNNHRCARSSGWGVATGGRGSACVVVRGVIAVSIMAGVPVSPHEGQRDRGGDETLLARKSIDPLVVQPQSQRRWIEAVEVARDRMGRARTVSGGDPHGVEQAGNRSIGLGHEILV